MYGSPAGEHPMLEIRVKRMCRTPPYNRAEARERLITDLRTLGVPRLEADAALADRRPNVPLGELNSGCVERLLSLIDRWIYDVQAHTAEPEDDDETR